MADLTDEELEELRVVLANRPDPMDVWDAGKFESLVEEVQRRRAADSEPEHPGPGYRIDVPDLVAVDPKSVDRTPLVPAQYREVTYHRCAGNVLNDRIDIVPVGYETSGGAHRRYRIEWKNLRGDTEVIDCQPVIFHTGDPRQATNGISNEALLAIVQHRLEGFQSGPFACYDNEVSLHHVKIAMAWMHTRTRCRLDRGVDGQPIK